MNSGNNNVSRLDLHVESRQAAGDAVALYEETLRLAAALDITEPELAFSSLAQDQDFGTRTAVQAIFGTCRDLQTRGVSLGPAIVNRIGQLLAVVGDYESAAEIFSQLDLSGFSAADKRTIWTNVALVQIIQGDWSGLLETAKQLVAVGEEASSKMEGDADRTTVSDQVSPCTDGESPPPDADSESGDRDPLYLDENVQFTVYRPRTVRPGKWFPLLAFAHLSERPPDADSSEPDPTEQVKQQAEQVLGEQADDFQDVTQDSLQAVPREGELTMVPVIDKVRFNPPSRTFLWQETIHREEFRLCADPCLNGKTARGRLSVYLGSILLADVPLTIRVEENAAPTERQESVAAQPYRKIFASYSHRDLQVVEQFEHLATMLGDQYLRDWTHLRAGQVWNDRLLEMIREADVFQLFWSTNSMRSPYVRQEWEYALSLNRQYFIRPTYWEHPLPCSEAEQLPPESLRRLHFQRLDFADGSTAEPAKETAVPAEADVAEAELDEAELAESEQPVAAEPPPAPEPAETSPRENAFGDLKHQIHGKLVDKLDLSRAADLDDDVLKREVRLVIEHLCDTEGALLNRTERTRLVDEVLDETFGLGPLETLLRDKSIREIRINGSRGVYVRRDSGVESFDVVFRDNDHLLQIIDRILSKVGQRADEANPVAEARLADGCRVTVVLPPLALNGPTVLLRPDNSAGRDQELLRIRQSMTPELESILKDAIDRHLNIAIVGAPGSGTVSWLNFLVGLVQDGERIITIEDFAELKLTQPDVVRLETRPADIGGQGAVSAGALVRLALRLQPDRVVVGDCGGGEAHELLQAMTAGHQSWMTTIAGSSPRDGLSRMEILAQSSGLTGPAAILRDQIAQALDLVIQTERGPDAISRVSRVTEVAGVRDGDYMLADVFECPP